MISLLEDLEQLERPPAPDPMAAPAAGSLVLHCALFGSLMLYGMLNGFFHRMMWGNPGAGGAIQVSLVSNALPLPADQPPNQNVLATETPSQAPAEPTPKAKQAVDEKAIPFAGKQKKPQPKAAPKSQQRQPVQDNRARYGEQAGSLMPRAMQAEGGSNGPVSVSNGDFGTRFGWYVEIIKRKVDQNWYRGVVDPRTPRGATSQIYFKVSRQGVPSNFKINISSGSPTLDRSCLQATQRVDTFGALPPDSNDQWLDVTYDCAY
ncbi:MAG: TonB family protein [Terracidiphilus sp.]|jgi:protein TonB